MEDVGDDFHRRLIGIDATLGPLETRRDLPVEVGILGILTCPTAAVQRFGAFGELT